MRNMTQDKKISKLFFYQILVFYNLLFSRYSVLGQRDLPCSVARKNLIFHPLDSYLPTLSIYFCNTDLVTYC